jgi:hypothetical protein
VRRFFKFPTSPTDWNGSKDLRRQWEFLGGATSSQFIILIQREHCFSSPPLRPRQAQSHTARYSRKAQILRGRQWKYTFVSASRSLEVVITTIPNSNNAHCTNNSNFWNSVSISTSFHTEPFPDIILLGFLSDQNKAFQITVSLAYTLIPAQKKTFSSCCLLPLLIQLINYYTSRSDPTVSMVCQSPWRRLQVQKYSLKLRKLEDHFKEGVRFWPIDLDWTV